MRAGTPESLASTGSGTPERLVPTPCVVTDVWSETGDVTSLSLEAAGDAPLVVGTPGQFNMLWAFGVGESAISISAGGDGAPLVHSIRAVGNVTRALCDAQPGDVIGLRGPFGRGWPIDAARGRDVLVIAGGIGLAPLRPVVHVLEADREAFGRVAVLYGTRTPGDILFRSELERWRSRLDFDVDVTVDAATREWGSNVGVVTELLPRAAFDPASTEAFVCGPQVMMDFVVRMLLDAGVASEAIHLSMERSMRCAVGFCGHCQWGADFLCKDGPVFRHADIAARLAVRER